MKELIEKIKEISTKYKSYTSNEIIIYASNRGVVKGVELCINEIQGQESKPFNPLELGLIYDNDENAEHDGWFITKQYENNRTLRTVLIHAFDNKYSLHVEAFRNNKWVFQFYVINVITIPNHRQGVELLRNLGVIE